MKCCLQAVVFSFAMFCIATCGGAFATDRQDVTDMPAAEIKTLQQRLTDDGCYSGPLDGQPSAATKAAIAACPDQRPQLRIETGMHVGPIKQIVADARCTFAATVANDRTVRFWSSRDGQLIRTFRFPIEKDFGRLGLNTLAISPNGNLIAIGGYQTGKNSITILDTATGTIERTIGSYSGGIQRLAFSPNGRMLAVAFGQGNVQILDVVTGRNLFADSYPTFLYLDVAFAADGTFYTVSGDGFIRRYDANFRLSAKIATQVGPSAYPDGIAVNQTGTRIAVYFSNSTAIELYEAPSLSRITLIKTPEMTPYRTLTGNWLLDGRLASAGKYGDQIFTEGKEHRYGVINFWTAKGLPSGKPMTVADDEITSLASCGPNVTFASEDNTLGLLTPDGAVHTFWLQHQLDFRGLSNEDWASSKNGTQVRFRLNSKSKSRLLFDVTKAALTEDSILLPNFHTSRVDGLLIDGHGVLFHEGVELPPDNRARSFAIRPDADGYIVGTDYTLLAGNAAGERKWTIRARAAVWGLNFAQNGQIIIAAYADGTIRWHRWSDGQELLALFVNKETKTWVAWTPTGYYMASPGGEDMIGWHINRGWAQAADFFPASKFHDQFARPDIVEKVLDTLDEAEAVKQANAARGKVLSSNSITDRLPPVISILSPANGSSSDDRVKIDYLVRSPSGLPVDAVEVLINGRPASAERGLGRVTSEDSLSKCLIETQGLGRKEASGLQGCLGSLNVMLPPGVNEIGLIARSGDRTSDIAAIRVTRILAANGDELLKPKLYALVVGISAYQNHDYILTYPAKDARDFADALQNQKGGLYADVTIRLLVDNKATNIAIRDGLDWLKTQISPRDVGVVYLAGHGMLDERDRFYFLAADSDATRLLATAIPRDDISETLDALRGNALLFLDACHSGAIVGKDVRRDVDINGVINDFTRGEHGVVAFTASTGKQASQENAAWNNGAFTKAVVEGLGLPGKKAAADLLGDGKITTSELDAYVRKRVSVLTDNTQSPIMIRPPTVPDFPLAVAR